MTPMDLPTAAKLTGVGSTLLLSSSLSLKACPVLAYKGQCSLKEDGLLCNVVMVGMSHDYGAFCSWEFVASEED